jgi:glycosyltransferase involved in cell wall biosynthesis
MRRLAIVLSHPVQYYSPWFRWLRAHTKLEFRVFYLWEFGVTAQRDPQFGRVFQWDVDLLTGYDSEFVPNVSRDPGTHHFNGLNNPELTDRLAAWQPGAVLLFGYNWRSHLRVVWWARRQGVPLLFRGDSHLLGREELPLARRLPLKFLYRQFAAITYVGRANRAYFRALGVPDKRLFFAPHSVNSAHFTPDDRPLREAADNLRRQLDVSNRKVVLFAGKLSEAKDPMGLLNAYLSIASARDALVFVGDGSEKARLMARAAEKPDARVIFLPFANQSEMPLRYLMADLFVLPSQGLYETWGLAVNEAMHMSLPCVVSDLVGCQQDLVVHNETGWVFLAGHQAMLANALRHALGLSVDQLRDVGHRARLKAARYTYRETTEGLLAAVASLPG